MRWGFVVVALVSVVAVLTQLLCPTAIDVRVEALPTPLRRYDDGAGHLPLLVDVRITNLSDGSIWFLGTREVPVYVLQQTVGKKVESKIGGTLSEARWTKLRAGESINVQAGPIEDDAREMRVGLAFTAEKFTPSAAHWVLSPGFRIAKRGHDSYPEPKEGSHQEEQVLPLGSPGRTWLRFSGP
jgi:hypothetical protein